jgi:hypothetical protein
MKQPVSLQLRDKQQLLGKISKIVCNLRGNVFRAAAAREDRVEKMVTPQQKAFCILRNCRLTGYFIINM